MLKAFALDTVKSSTQYLEREMMQPSLAPPRGDSAHPGGFRLEVIRLLKSHDDTVSTRRIFCSEEEEGGGNPRQPSEGFFHTATQPPNQGAT